MSTDSTSATSPMSAEPAAPAGALPASPPSAGHFLDALIARGRELYTLPKVALDVLELTEQPQTDAMALKECIECDPALTARILRVVNSSLFSLHTQVTDLAHAIGLLGIKPLKLLVLGFSLPPAMFDGLDESALELYWKTSLIRAAACREIARATRRTDPEESFVAGLLEDLGILLLIQQLRESYTRFYLDTCEQPNDLAQVEREELGFDHRQLTSRMLRAWHFPDRIVDAIARPPAWAAVSEMPEETKTLALLLRLAEHLVQLLSLPGHQDVRALVEEAERSWQLSIDDVRSLVDRLEGSVPPLAEIFAVPWDCDQYTRCLMAAHQAMSAATEDAAFTAHAPPDGAHEAGQGHGASVRAALQQFIQHGTAIEVPPAANASNTTGKERSSAATTSRHHRSVTLDPGLEGRLQQAVLVARKCQRPLGLCMVGVDDPRQVELQLGLDRATAVWQLAIQLVDQELQTSLPAMHAADGQIAAICIGHARSSIISGVRRVIDQFSDTVRASLGVEFPGLLSAGVAVIPIPPRNMDVGAFTDAAQRCLFAAQAAGGHTVKSIEL